MYSPGSMMFWVINSRQVRRSEALAAVHKPHGASATTASTRLMTTKTDILTRGSWQSTGPVLTTHWHTHGWHLPPIPPLAPVLRPAWPQKLPWVSACTDTGFNMSSRAGPYSTLLFGSSPNLTSEQLPDFPEERSSCSNKLDMSPAP